MKTLSFFFLIPLALITSCSIKINDKDSDGDSFDDFFSSSKTINGTGEFQHKTYNMDFDAIKVTSGIHAEVIKSDVEKIVISAPSDLLNEVLVEKSDGELKIHFKPNLNIRNSSLVKATIFAKDFSGLAASSSGKIVVKDKFTQDKMDVKASSSGDITGNLEANNFNLQVSSSGSFTGRIWAVDFKGSVSSSGDADISGSATNTTFQASSSGKLDAARFNTKNADLQASSSGDISMQVSENLTGSASSSGDIQIQKSGNLKTQNIQKSSGGDISIQ